MSGSLTRDLRAIIDATRPRVVYTHNLADKHDTHVAVALAVLRAIRELPLEARPRAVYGCEGWRDLDWMIDGDKLVQDVGGNVALATAINSVFESQIACGKRYDLAVLGRRRANATFLNPHAADRHEMSVFAMDLTPLALDPTLSIADHVLAHIARFADDVRNRLLGRLGGQ